MTQEKEMIELDALQKGLANPFKVTKYKSGEYADWKAHKPGRYRMYLADVLFIQDRKMVWQGETKYKDCLKFKFLSTDSYPDGLKADGESRPVQVTVIKTASLHERASLPKFLELLAPEEFDTVKNDLDGAWELVRALKGRKFDVRVKASEDERWNNFVNADPVTDEGKAVYMTEGQKNKDFSDYPEQKFNDEDISF